MPRKTSRYALDTFLRQLARTGNFALSADLAGLAKSGLYKRRARDKGFARGCAEALVNFCSNLPSRSREGQGEGMSLTTVRPSRSEPQALLTAPDDLVLINGQSRPSQIRRSPAGRLTQAGIDAFLMTLAATANIRLAARSVGVAASSIYRRCRADDRFDRAVQQALRIGYQQVEAALLESAHRALDPDPEYEAWLEANGGAAMEPMTFDQAIMLLTLHRNAIGIPRTRRDRRQADHNARYRTQLSDEELRASLVRSLAAFGRRLEE